MAENSLEIKTPAEKAAEFVDKAKKGLYIEEPLTPDIAQAVEENMRTMEEADKIKVREALEKLKSSTRQEIERPYLEKQQAFAEAFMGATSFPFTVKYTEGGKSYVVEVESRGDTIIVGGKSFRLHNFLINITDISLNEDKVILCGYEEIDKRALKDLAALLAKDAGTYDFGKGINAGKITISGDFSPKEISTPKEKVDKGMLEKLTTLKTELEKRMKEGLTPVDLAEGLKYISDTVKDEPTKQMAINFLMNQLAREYTVLFERDDSLNVIPKDVKNMQMAATYQNALQSSLTANHVSRKNIQESMTMLTGQKWSNYARTIADPNTASAQGYAKYLADTYGLDIVKKPISQIRNHKSMTAEDKAWLLSYLNGQMDLNVTQVTKIYQENLKSYQTLIDSPFFAVLNKATGGKKMTPDEAKAAADAAARGSNEGGDGKTATWTLGILGAIVGLGFKKGESWSLWTALKRIFMGGLAIGGVMLGCAAGREWKKELGMDVCDEAKKAMKDAFKEMKDGITNNGNATPATPATTPNGQQQASAAPAPATTPTNSIDVSKLSPEQKKIHDKLSANTALANQINTAAESNKNLNRAEKGDFKAYISYIFGDKLQGIKLDKLIYTSNPQTGVFGNIGSVDLSLGVPPELDNNTVKYILREYLIGKGPLEVMAGKSQGQKEREEFEAKYSPETWGQRTLSDITKEIHK